MVRPVGTGPRVSACYRVLTEGELRGRSFHYTVAIITRRFRRNLRSLGARHLCGALYLRCSSIFINVSYQPEGLLLFFYDAYGETEAQRGEKLLNFIGTKSLMF